MPQERDEMDEEQQTFFQTGTNVGLLARELFPGGVDATPATTFLYQQSVADTARFIQEGHTIIYEAAFQHEGLLCAVDILVKEKNKWVVYEVKSTNSVKEAFYTDAAFQHYVIDGAGLQLNDFCITHLNRDYVRQGALDIEELFVHESVLDEIQVRQIFIQEKPAELKALVKSKTMPDIEIGGQCTKPYPCDFNPHCSIFSLKRIKSHVFSISYQENGC